MTATGKVSPRLSVSYFSQKDKLTPIVFSKTFISSLILADLGPEWFFFSCRAFPSCLTAFCLRKPLQLGKGKTVANLSLCQTSPRWQSADETQEDLSSKKPFISLLHLGVEHQGRCIDIQMWSVQVEGGREDLRAPAHNADSPGSTTPW